MSQYHLWSWSLIGSIWGDIAGLLLSLCVLLRLGGVMTRKARSDWFSDANRGSVIIQFALLTPLLFALLLVIFQTALIVQAKLVVNYAAFCAARSAIVVIPSAVRAAISGRAENEGQIFPLDPASPKMNIIRRAGALACAGISPRWTLELALKTGEQFSLSQAANLTSVGFLFPPLGLTDQNPLAFPVDFASRSQYALTGANSAVQIAVQRHPGSADKASYQMVTVVLTYRYYLTVPFASRIFGTRYPGVLNRFNSAYYLPTREQYTLLAEDDFTFPPDQAQNLFQVDNYQ